MIFHSVCMDYYRIFVCKYRLLVLASTLMAMQQEGTRSLADCRSHPELTEARVCSMPFPPTYRLPVVLQQHALSPSIYTTETNGSFYFC